MDISVYPPEAKVIAQAMKTYGMILADNGSAWYFTGMTGTRWDDTQLNALKALTGNDLEVVPVGEHHNREAIEYLCDPRHRQLR